MFKEAMFKGGIDGKEEIFVTRSLPTTARDALEKAIRSSDTIADKIIELVGRDDAKAEESLKVTLIEQVLEDGLEGVVRERYIRYYPKLPQEFYDIESGYAFCDSSVRG